MFSTSNVYFVASIFPMRSDDEMDAAAADAEDGDTAVDAQSNLGTAFVTTILTFCMRNGIIICKTSIENINLRFDGHDCDDRCSASKHGRKIGR